MSTVEASLAGPKRPQDRVLLSQVPNTFDALMDLILKPVKEERASGKWRRGGAAVEAKHANLSHENVFCMIEGKKYPLQHGDVVISAITSFQF